jgi:hypothetical protein
MLVKNKWICISYTVVGVIIALANAYLFLSRHMAWDGVMFLVGIGWIWLGVSNLWRLQNVDPK